MNVLGWIKEYFFRVKKILKWIFFLWNDCDWEGAFILRILQFKLTQVYHYYQFESTKHEGVVEIMRQLEECLELLHRLVGNDYEYYEIEEILNHQSMGELDKLFSVADAAREKDLTRLFEIIGKNIDKWWD